MHGLPRRIRRGPGTDDGESALGAQRAEGNDAVVPGEVGGKERRVGGGARVRVRQRRVARRCRRHRDERRMLEVRRCRPGRAHEACRANRKPTTVLQSRVENGSVARTTGRARVQVTDLGTSLGRPIEHRRHRGDGAEPPGHLHSAPGRRGSRCLRLRFSRSRGPRWCLHPHANTAAATLAPRTRHFTTTMPPGVSRRRRPGPVFDRVCP